LNSEGKIVQKCTMEHDKVRLHTRSVLSIFINLHSNSVCLIPRQDTSRPQTRELEADQGISSHQIVIGQEQGRGTVKPIVIFLLILLCTLS